MLSPDTESANARTILDAANRRISRNSSLCPQRYSVPSVVKVSRIPKSAATAPPRRPFETGGLCWYTLRHQVA